MKLITFDQFAAIGLLLIITMIVITFAGCKTTSGITASSTVCKDGVCLTYDPTNGTTITVAPQVEK